MGLPVCSRGLTPVWVKSWNTVKLPGSGSQVCSHRKSVSKRAPCLPTSPSCSSHHTNTSPTQKPGHFQHHMRRLQQSRKYFSCFKKKIPKGYGLCCWTIMLAVSVYKLIWIGFSSPSTDSEVVTALGVRMRPCYRVEKGSGGLSGGWWDAATFIPGTRTGRQKKRKKEVRGIAWKKKPILGDVVSSYQDICLWVRDEGAEGFAGKGKGKTNNGQSYDTETYLM